jgi:hypothetical protein
MKLRFLSLVMLAACGTDESSPNGLPGSQNEPPIEQQADNARAIFDDIFMSAQYERIPEARAALQSVYDKDPSVNDGDVAMLLGVTYLWSTAEWERDASRSDDERYEEVLLGDEVLTAAKGYRPQDGRVHGWLGIMKAFRAQKELDLALYHESVDLINEGVSLYPQFALLVVSFVKSSWPAMTTEFTDAVEHIWRNVDVCIMGEIDRTNPDFAPYMSLTSDTEGNRRACWNTPVVPHNLEGFWFHMGDLLVKNNQPDVAQIAYGNAKLVPGYSTWRYRSELEDRLARTHENAAAYLDDDSQNDPPLLPQTTFQCTLCHAR